MARAALLLLLASIVGCTVRATPDGGPPDTRRDAGRDAGLDAPPLDAPPPLDAGVDAPIDAGLDAPDDAGVDAPSDSGTDAPSDAGTDAPLGCAISAGDTVSLDGTSDIAAYPASQLLVPGVPVAATDVFALTWDRSFLYVTMTSDGFAADAFEPVHVYLETGTSLGTPVATPGKEYGGLTATLPFSPTHVIALRRTSDSGTGAYDGVYRPGGTPAWGTRETPLTVGTNVYVSADGRTLSARVPWTALGGCPTRMRLAAHVVHGDLAMEWKDVVPTTHTPWVASGGSYYDIDLTADPAVTGWTLR